MEDRFQNSKVAVLFDWSGTLTFNDSNADFREVTIQGAKELIEALRSQGFSPFVATGGRFHPGMSEIGFGHNEVLFVDTGFKGQAVDRVRSEGFERVVYVGDGVLDVAHPAMKEIPVIIFESGQDGFGEPEKVKANLDRNCQRVQMEVAGADVSFAYGLDELMLVVEGAISRARLPENNKTFIRAFADFNFASETAGRLTEILKHNDNFETSLDRSGAHTGANVPSGKSVTLAVTPYFEGQNERFQIEIDFPLEIESKTISDAIGVVTSELRAKGVFGPYAGFAVTTRYPDDSRPRFDNGLDLN